MEDNKLAPEEQPAMALRNGVLVMPKPEPTPAASPRNPKQEGSRLIDCVPQTGACPRGCNQCYYNRPGAWYASPDLSHNHMPSLEEVGDMIVRVNSGHDSNVDREFVIEATAHYAKRYFNTSIPAFDFPGPVMFTANHREEESATLPQDIAGGPPMNLMAVRLRTSATNLQHIRDAVNAWTRAGVPVVLTFMAYYTEEPKFDQAFFGNGIQLKDLYEWKKRILNSYWCSTPLLKKHVRAMFKDNPLVFVCGTYESGLCKDCNLCEIQYLTTAKRLQELAPLQAEPLGLNDAAAPSLAQRLVEELVIQCNTLRSLEGKATGAAAFADEIEARPSVAEAYAAYNRGDVNSVAWNPVISEVRAALLEVMELQRQAIAK